MPWNPDAVIDALAEARFGKHYHDYPRDHPVTRSHRDNVEFAVEVVRQFCEQAFKEGQLEGYEDHEMEVEEPSPNPYKVT
jgi:hypothetical protein